MKTQEQKMQHVMEAAGECYHKNSWPATGRVPHTWECSLCGLRNGSHTAPQGESPNDLNELFRLADKLEICIEADICAVGRAQVSTHHGFFKLEAAGQSLEGLPIAEALLNALFIATGGKDA